ncbi:putative carboxylesterase [Xylogone sp. PMI_703]|nr:putative carboxylesterase [Xylogone sp. PMI_703]
MPRLQHLLSFSILWGIITSQDTPHIKIQNGTIHGMKCRDSNSNAYLGIPFGEPPTGNLRFSPPQPYSSSFPGGLLNATTPPPACIQFGEDFLEDLPWSEDCLFLDVWTPQEITGESDLPVLFWIYGGSFTAGGISNPLYDGCYLASDAVVVSANYRLGPLGYLALPDAGIEGNMGFQDLILALNWVQENIAAFGGDPKKVAVYGQSAGAIQTWALSTLPYATSLMRAAIAESGAGTGILSAQSVQTASQSYAASLGCNTSDVDCFRSKSTQQLKKALSGGSLLSGEGSFLFPYVDGKVIPANPNNIGSKVPLLAGTTTREAALFDIESYPNVADLTAANYTSALQTDYGNSSTAVLFQYPFSEFSSEPLAGWSAIVSVETISTFFCPTAEALGATLRAGVSAYTYLWNHTSSCPWYPSIPAFSVPILGAAHTSEIPFVFNHTSRLPAPNGNCSLTLQEVAISHSLAASWKSMAVDGNPGNNLANGTKWPEYSVNTSIGMIVNNSTQFGFINYTQCTFWANLESSTSQSNGISGGGSTTEPINDASKRAVEFEWFFYAACTMLAVFWM